MKLRRSANENSTRATGRAQKLSREWMREIERRVRDSEDPVRHMLVSEFSRSFILYYNVSDDMFTMNAPGRGLPGRVRNLARDHADAEPHLQGSDQ